MADLPDLAGARGMELADVLRLLRRRWRLIAAIAVLGCLGGLVGTLLATPVYRSTSQVFVSVRGGDSTTDLLQGSSFTVRQVGSYAELVRSPRVLEPVIESLALTDTPAQLAGRVQADVPLDTVLINVTVDALHPQEAADIANGIAASLAVVVGELETREDAAESTVQISTVRSAAVPTAPSSPDIVANLASGLAVGLVAGLGVAVLREMLNTTLRDIGDVEALTGRTALAVIVDDQDDAARGQSWQAWPRSLHAEAFRRLRTNLQFLEATSALRAIVVTSSVPAEGKTSTSIDLALTLADAGRRVVLVDADLRRPMVATYLGLERSVGLTTVLIGRAEVEDVIQPCGKGGLHVITSGMVPPNPSELLGSAAMDGLVDLLATRYDVVLIDSPPLLPFTDGALLTRMVGGALLVVRVGSTHRHQALDALRSLQAVDACLLGVVGNRVPATTDGTGYYERYRSGLDFVDAPARTAQPAAVPIWPSLHTFDRTKV